MPGWFPGEAAPETGPLFYLIDPVPATPRAVKKAEFLEIPADFSPSKKNEKKSYLIGSLGR